MKPVDLKPHTEAVAAAVAQVTKAFGDMFAALAPLATRRMRPGDTVEIFERGRWIAVTVARIDVDGFTWRLTVAGGTGSGFTAWESWRPVEGGSSEGGGR